MGNFLNTTHNSVTSPMGTQFSQIFPNILLNHNRYFNRHSINKNMHFSGKLINLFHTNNDSSDSDAATLKYLNDN